MRLKLIAPFHSPRAPRPRRPSVALSSAPWPLELFFRLAMTALRLHHLGLARHGRAADFLAQGWTLLTTGCAGQFDPGATVDRCMDGLDDCDIDQALLARGFRIRARADAAREIHQLGRELIALGELLPFLLLAHHELVAEAFGVLVGRFN